MFGHFKRYSLLLAICLLLGAGLRCVGLTRGASNFLLPEQGRAGVEEPFYHFHPDEEMVIRAALAPFDPFDPPITTYGMLPSYLLRAAVELCTPLLGWTAPALDSPASARRVYYVARVLAVLYSCAVLALLWALGRRYFDATAACLGVAFMAFAAGAVQQAHFYIVDGLFALANVAAMWASLRALEMGGRHRYAAAGALIGLTAAVRLNGALLGLVLLVGHLFKEGSSGTWRGIGRRFLQADLWLAGASCMVVLVAVQPYLLTDPTRLVQVGSAVDFAYSLKIVQGEVVRPWTLVDWHTLPYVHHWTHLWPLIVGWPLTLFFMPALAYVVWKRDLWRLLMVLWCLLYFALIGGLLAKSVRYLLPLLPFFALFAGFLGAELGRLRRVWWRRAGLGITVWVAGYTVCYGWAFAHVYTVEDSRLQAGRWIAAHAEPGSRIGVERGGFSMRNLVGDGRVRIDLMRLFYLAPYMLCQTRVDHLHQQVRDLDYIAAVEANRYRQFTAAPDLYPVAADFYRQLFAGELGFETRQFKHYPRLLGWEFGDDDAEPSFTGYDHPAVFVLQRQSEAAVDRTFARWRQQIDDDPHCVDNSLRRASELLRGGDAKGAQQVIQEVVRNHPDAKIAYLLEAEIYLLLGDEVGERAARLRFRPEYPAGFTARLSNPDMRIYIAGEAGLALAELGLADLAVGVLREDLAEGQGLDPPGMVAQMAEAYVDVAIQLFKADHLAQAEEVLRLALELHPEKRAYNLLASVVYQRADVDGALALWRQSLGLDAQQAEIHKHVGVVTWLKLRDRERALHHIERAIELEPMWAGELQRWLVELGGDGGER